MTREIFVLGYYGWKNTGDDAMLYSLLEGLKEVFPDSRFNITAASWPSTPEDVNINLIPPRVNPNFIKAFLRSSIFILGGGTHFFDYGNTFKRIIRLTQILLLTLISKITGKDIYFMGVGVEPPSHVWSKFIIKNTCAMATKIFVRDSISMKVLGKMGIEENVELSQDLAFFLEYEKPVKTKGLLGVSVMPYHEIYMGDESGDEIIIKEFTRAIREWLEINPNNSVRLFVFNGKPPNDDERISRKILNILDDERVQIEPYNKDPQETLRKVGSCEAFVAMKFHAALFAYLNDLPTIIVEYALKNRALAHDARFPEGSLIRLEELDGKRLKKTIRDLHMNPDNYKAKVKPSDLRVSFPALIR
ncbi:MAG: polysaccharide pyruvyl transferase family protein [Methanothermobacter sp.]|nr:polysaccharide pyruvyl transferase family protein [Methanothermobacter sp.]